MRLHSTMHENLVADLFNVETSKQEAHRPVATETRGEVKSKVLYRGSRVCILCRSHRLV